MNAEPTTVHTDSAPDLRSMLPAELEALVRDAGERPYRAGQLFSWMHEHRASSFEEMTNLPKKLRETLAAEKPLVTLAPVRIEKSRLDGTRKYLFALPDRNIIESVWMPYHHGNSVCISSQVGCRMGCRFCASTLDGLVRNLTASEMLEQVYRMEADTGERVSNIVVMGSGEPLDNFEAVTRFITLATMEGGLHISHRNITLSTCGLVPRIRELADTGLDVTLAVSLHAATDEKRKQLMPVANRWSIPEILEACDYYFEKTGRRITFEYALAEGENDSPADAEALSGLLSGRNAHVNLIPVNPVKERKFRRSAKKVVAEFQKHLEKCGINVTIRREMGADINGACGQLRKSFLEQSDSITL